jgi:hypothetical protein
MEKLKQELKQLKIQIRVGIDQKQISQDWGILLLDNLEVAINYTRCSTQFNALLQKETEVIYKSVKYYIFLIDYNKEVASIKQVEGTWIEYNIPFKELTKSI